jgi:hypothetical protein
MSISKTPNIAPLDAIRFGLRGREVGAEIPVLPHDFTAPAGCSGPPGRKLLRPLFLPFVKRTLYTAQCGRAVEKSRMGGARFRCLPGPLSEVNNPSTGKYQ